MVENSIFQTRKLQKSSADRWGIEGEGTRIQIGKK